MPKTQRDPPTDPEATVYTAPSANRRGVVHFDNDCDRLLSEAHDWSLSGLTRDDGELLWDLSWCQYCRFDVTPEHTPPSKAYRALERCDPDDFPPNAGND